MDNEPLLHDAWSAILADPKSWNQGSYGKQTPCGTTFCLAGHVAVLAGAEVLTSGSWVEFSMPGYHVTTLAAYEIARDALGLSCEEADTLFVDSMSVGDLKEMAEIIKSVTDVVVKAPVEF